MLRTMLILSILWKWEGGIQWFLGILWYWGWYVLFFGHHVVLRGGINKIACFLVRLKIFNTIYSFFSLTLLWVICCPIQCRFPIFKFVSLQQDVFTLTAWLFNFEIRIFYTFWPITNKQWSSWPKFVGLINMNGQCQLFWAQLSQLCFMKHNTISRQSLIQTYLL